eukprot:1644109-Alexandrium_andersonii.AAC.1
MLRSLVFRGPLQQASSVSWVWMLDSEASCTEVGELPVFPSNSGGRQSKNLGAGRLHSSPGVLHLNRCRAIQECRGWTRKPTGGPR